MFGQVYSASFILTNVILGHSQGGLLMRVMTQVIDNHNVDTLVSMAGVQNGVYGAGFLNNKFGNLTGSYYAFHWSVLALVFEFKTS